MHRSTSRYARELVPWFWGCDAGLLVALGLLWVCPLSRAFSLDTWVSGCWLLFFFSFSFSFLGLSFAILIDRYSFQRDVSADRYGSGGVEEGGGSQGHPLLFPVPFFCVPQDRTASRRTAPQLEHLCLISF